MNGDGWFPAAIDIYSLITILQYLQVRLSNPRPSILIDISPEAGALTRGCIYPVLGCLIYNDHPVFVRVLGFSAVEELHPGGNILPVLIVSHFFQRTTLMLGILLNFCSVRMVKSICLVGELFHG
jgi:hypothetical protein